MIVRPYKKDIIPDETLTLGLVEKEDGVMLAVVDMYSGNPVACGCLLTITHDGQLRLHGNISESFGLLLYKDTLMLKAEEGS